MFIKIKEFLSSELNLIRILLFIPILFVLVISLTHMTTWFMLSDSYGWAKFLSTAIVLITFSTIAASKYTKFSFVAYIPIFLVEFFGNYFHAFTNIDIKSKEFMDWTTAIEPLTDLLFYNADIIANQRMLAVIHGGVLPLIALIFFTFLLFLKNVKKSAPVPTPKSEQTTPPTPIEIIEPITEPVIETKVEQVVETKEVPQIIEEPIEEPIKKTVEVEVPIKEVVLDDPSNVLVEKIGLDEVKSHVIKEVEVPIETVAEPKLDISAIKDKVVPIKKKGTGKVIKKILRKK